MIIFRVIASWIYGLVVWVRNLLYDERLIFSSTVTVPTICVGNLAVGGTGKTPHTEYLVRLLKDNFSIAVLSRGYKRQTSGFVMATAESTAQDIGDEPKQIHSKFPDVPLAVCENRIRGIHQLQKRVPKLQLVILDDAFQYRKLRSKMNILLTTADNLYINDHLLPWGRLRDTRDQALRANIVIVTKCDEQMKPIDKRVIETSLHLPQYQTLYFSHIRYGEIRPAFPQMVTELLPRSRNYPLVLTAIENPQPMYEYIKRQYANAELMAFPDHYTFTKRDIQRILTSPYIITTEKDLARLEALPYYPDELKQRTFVLPIEVDFNTQTQQFNQHIYNYVKENNRNR